MIWTNILTDVLKVTYPIIQAPLLGVSTPEMAAAVSNEGGLGSLAVGGLSPIPPYPLQNAQTAKLRKLAQQNNDSEYTSLWAGQSTGKTGMIPANEVFRNLVEQYEVQYK